MTPNAYTLALIAELAQARVGQLSLLRLPVSQLSVPEQIMSQELERLTAALLTIAGWASHPLRDPDDQDAR